MLLKLHSVEVERYLDSRAIQLQSKKTEKILFVIQTTGKTVKPFLECSDSRQVFLINTLLGSFYSHIWQLPKKFIPSDPIGAFKQTVS